MEMNSSPQLEQQQQLVVLRGRLGLLAVDVYCHRLRDDQTANQYRKAIVIKPITRLEQ